MLLFAKSGSFLEEMSSGGLTEGISPLGHFLLRFFFHEGWWWWCWLPPQMSLVFKWKPSQPEPKYVVSSQGLGMAPGAQWQSCLRPQQWLFSWKCHSLSGISELAQMAFFLLSVEPGSACHCAGLYVFAVPVTGGLVILENDQRGQGVWFH